MGNQSHQTRAIFCSQVSVNTSRVHGMTGAGGRPRAGPAPDKELAKLRKKW